MKPKILFFQSAWSNETIYDAQKTYFQELIEKVRSGQLGELIPIFSEAVLSQQGIKNSKLKQKVEAMPKTLGAMSCVNHHTACCKWQDHSQELRTVKTDTLVLAGEQDVAVPITDVKALAKCIPNATFYSIPGAGHLMTLEAPEQVNKYLNDFL